MTAPDLGRPVAILDAGCVCGHDHETHRGEPVEMCIEWGCDCIENIARCRNCGEPARWPQPNEWTHDACSTACWLQIQYALALTRATA